VFRRLRITHVHIGIQVPLVVLPDSPGNRWPGIGKSQHTLDTIALQHLTSLGMQDAWLDTKEGDSGATRLGGDGTREGSDDNRACLGLPECVDDGTFLVADMFIVPVPRLRVDRLSDGSENTNGRKVVAFHVLWAETAQETDGSRGRIELGEFVFCNRLPVSRRSRVNWGRFEDTDT
jgi:hypothetical protein